MMQLTSLGLGRWRRPCRPRTLSLRVQTFGCGRSTVLRETAVMLFWALRWHEGRPVAHQVLCDVLWGAFAIKPNDPNGTLREFVTSVKERYGDRWIITGCSRSSFRILPRAVFGLSRRSASVQNDRSFCLAAV